MTDTVYFKFAFLKNVPFKLIRYASKLHKMFLLSFIIIETRFSVKIWNSFFYKCFNTAHGKSKIYKTSLSVVHVCKALIHFHRHESNRKKRFLSEISVSGENSTALACIFYWNDWHCVFQICFFEEFPI